MAASLERVRELEEQVKLIPILQVQISVLKEEKRLLIIQNNKDEDQKTNSEKNSLEIFGNGSAQPWSGLNCSSPTCHACKGLLDRPIPPSPSPSPTRVRHVGTLCQPLSRDIGISSRISVRTFGTNTRKIKLDINRNDSFSFTGAKLVSRGTSTESCPFKKEVDTQTLDTLLTIYGTKNLELKNEYVSLNTSIKESTPKITRSCQTIPSEISTCGTQTPVQNLVASATQTNSIKQINVGISADMEPESCSKCAKVDVINASTNTIQIKLVEANSQTTESVSARLFRQNTYTKLSPESNDSVIISPDGFITKKEDISTNEELKSTNSTSEFEESTSNCVTSEQPLRNKISPTKEMSAALKVINDWLNKHSLSESKSSSLMNADTVVQLEWFKISSSGNANPLDVEDYLDVFEARSNLLLQYVVNMTDNSGNTAMHYAVSHGNFDVVSILLDSKVCNINKANLAGYTSTMLVALANIRTETHRQVVRRLFHLADVNQRATQNGQTALMLAVSHGRLETVRLLLEAGADLNIQDEDGSTALMCAAEHGHTNIAKVLLTNPDCDTSLTDCDGSTAMNIALESGHHDIGVLLYSHDHLQNAQQTPNSSYRIRRSRSNSTQRSSSPS